MKRKLFSGMISGTVLFFLLAVMLPLSVQALSLNDEEYGLHVCVLDVGQGLSVVAECDGMYCIFDGGPGSSSSKVVSFLKNNGVHTLDYMIASHYDEDHINGLIGALYNFPVGTLLEPYYVTDTSIYESYVNAVEQNGVEPTYLKAGQTYMLGSAVIQILAPVRQDYQSENDFSAAAKIQYGDTSILIMGDCTALSESDILLEEEDVSADILVVGHHGSDSSTTQAFLDAVQPSAAVISCGSDNSYGHPSEGVMGRLYDGWINVFRTDKQGDLYFASDGGDWYCSPDAVNDYSYRSYEEQPSGGQDSANRSVPQADAQDTGADEAAADASYVLNTNTMKFHYPYCASVEQMSARNRQYTSATREEIINAGYEPCKNCNP